MYYLLKPIAQELTKLDPEHSWIAQGYDGRFELVATNPDTQHTYTLSCHSPSWPHGMKNRISIGPASLFYADGQYFIGGHNHPRPRITVSKERTADSLARDIYRRIVPQAIEYIDWARGIIAEADARAAQHKAIQELIVDTCNGRLGWQERNVHGNGWTAEIGYHFDITLTLKNIDHETAIEIIHLIQKEQAHAPAR